MCCLCDQVFGTKSNFIKRRKNELILFQHVKTTNFNPNKCLFMHSDSQQNTEVESPALITRLFEKIEKFRESIELQEAQLYYECYTLINKFINEGGK